MSVPAATEQTLKAHNVQYGLVEIQPAAGQSPGKSTAKAMLFQDGKGKVQVIYSASCLLNLHDICKLTNRELVATTASEIESICEKLQMRGLSAVPKTLGYDVVVDQELLKSSELKLDSGAEDQVVTIATAEFKQLLDGATIGNFTVAGDWQGSQSNNIDTDDAQISAAVRNFTELRIKQRLEDTFEFPPLPETAQRIIKLRVNPDADTKELTDIVENDPSLAAQVVSWATSPYYAAPGKINSLHEAIVRVLGFDLVLNLSLGLSLGKTLKMPTDSAKGFSSYWKQSVYAATAVEALVRKIPPKDRPTMGLAYLSGLLHNFGYLVLSEVFPPHFSNICRYQESNPHSSHEQIEDYIIGVNRAQIGSWLMRMWNMPEEVCTAIRFQNAAEFDGDNGCYANLLYVALRLLRRHGIGNAPLETIPDEMFERLNLDREQATEAIENVMASATDLDMMASNMES